MSDEMQSHHHHPGQGGLLRSRAGLVMLGFLLVAGYFLVTEHRAHLALAIPYLPFLLLLACPLMHVFMHGGHGHSHGDDTNPQDKSTNSSPHTH